MGIAALGDFTLKRRVRGIVVYAGLCSAAVLFVVVATSASTTPTKPTTPSSSHIAVDQSPQSVDHSGKGDRLPGSKAFSGAGASIAVEVSGMSNVVVRDKRGNILFAVDSAARTTAVAKQSDSGAAPPHKVTAPAKRDLPDGCEGAFSAYAEPAMAGIIGRCVSNIFPGVKMPSQASVVS
jgi:hypothetical protein